MDAHPQPYFGLPHERPLGIWLDATSYAHRIRHHDWNRGGRISDVGRWKREKLEERRIEAALDALTLAYETKFVFRDIRSPMAHGYEWARYAATARRQ